MYRYNTYTITGDDSRESSLEPDVNLDCDILEENIEQGAKASKPRRLTPKQRRIADKDRFRTRTLGDEDIPVPSSPREKRLADKERFKTQTLDIAGVTVSNEEMHCGFADDENALAEEVILRDQVEEDIVSDGGDEDSDEKRGRPIVVKPGEMKSVRGRRKVRSHIPIVTRSSPVSNIKTPKPVKTPPPLQRQGTFTKDEPTTPSSGIPVFSKKTTQLKSVPGKKKVLPTYTVSASQVKKVAATSLGRGRAGSLPRSDPPKKPTGVRSSVSNQSLKSETLGSNSSLNSGSARWNSNSSLNAGPTAKKEATSKIASLWKKVEDSKKKKEVSGKDTRVWIAPTASPHSKQVSSKISLNKKHQVTLSRY